MKEPINVTDEAFERAIIQSEIPVLVDFWAPWCGPCKMVEPTLEKIAQEYDGKLVVARVNVDDNPEKPMEYQVQGIPTILFFHQGNVIHRQVGAVPEVYLLEMVEALFSTLEGSSE